MPDDARVSATAAAVVRLSEDWYDWTALSGRVSIYRAEVEAESDRVGHEGHRVRRQFLLLNPFHDT